MGSQRVGHNWATKKKYTTQIRLNNAQEEDKNLIKKIWGPFPQRLKSWSQGNSMRKNKESRDTRKTFVKSFLWITHRTFENPIITKMSPNYYYQILRNNKSTKNYSGQTWNVSHKIDIFGPSLDEDLRDSLKHVFSIKMLEVLFTLCRRQKHSLQVYIAWIHITREFMAKC